MPDVVTELRKRPAAPAPSSLYYGWVIVGVAALAMVGTLPGRTQGLGLITESLLQDLRLDRVAFGQMNLWATLLGSLFCLPVGRLLDQLGGRLVITMVSLALGGVVLAMSRTSSPWLMFLWLVLSRGLGQSALSVVSLTLVGQWFKRRLNLAMALYSVLLSVGFMAAFPLVGGAVLAKGWRYAWADIGGFLVFGLVPLGLLLVRPRPEDAGLPLEDNAAPEEKSAAPDFTWAAALRTPAFWVFALASSIYSLIASGIGLFNQSILAERGFAPVVYHRSLVIIALTSLAGNFLGGWLAARWNVNRLMALAMGLLAGVLLALPSLKTVGHVNMFALVMGLSGGFVIVIFFSFWANTFGRVQLGRIQGTAQMMTVLASAAGPLLLAKCQSWTGSYAIVFYLLAGFAGTLALAVWKVGSPRAKNE